MKISRDGWKATIDNEAIKAIRFCLGYTTDLRIKIKVYNRNALWNWIDQNIYHFFSATNFWRPDSSDDDWYKYDSMVNSMVDQIVG